MNGLLLFVLAIFIVGLVWGIKAGFVRVVYSLISTILIVVLTILLSPITQQILFENEKVYNSINDGVERFVDLTSLYNGMTDTEKAQMEEVSEAVGTSNEQEACTSAVDVVLEKLGLPEVIRKAVTSSEGFTELIKKNADELVKGNLDSLEKYVCKVFTKTIINALGFAITFVIISLAVYIVGKVLDLIVKIPVIKQVNKLAGIAAGLLEALLVVWLLFALITTFGATEFGQDLLKQINENSFLSMLYKNNLIAQRLFKDAMNV